MRKSPPKRLHQIRAAFKQILKNDRTLALDGPKEQYGKAASRLVSADIQTMVMGHTHLARHIGAKDRASYINTGTWADIVQVPDKALEDGNDQELRDFLSGLKNDTDVRGFRPAFAEIAVDSDGNVQQASLKEDGS